MDQAPPNTNPVNQPLTMPDAWPGATGLYKYSKEAVSTNLGTIILLGLSTIAASIVVSIIISVLHLPSGIGTLATYLIDFWLGAASIIVYLASVRHTKMSPGEALKQAQKYYFNFLVASVITWFLAALSLLLFIIPFFFVFPRLTLVNYYLIDKNMSPIDAVKASWNGTKGHAGKVWGIWLLTFGMALLIIVLVGIYFLIMYSAAMALLYVFITGHQAAPAPTAVVPETNPQAPVPPAPAV